MRSLRHSMRGWLLPSSVLVAFLAATLAGNVAARRAVEHEERILLEQRASEIEAILSTSSTLTTSLQLIGEAYAADPSGTAFEGTAGSLVSGAVTAVGVAELVDDTVTVRVEHGVEAPAGSSLAGARSELIRTASAAEGLVSTLVKGEPNGSLIVGLARDDGSVVFQESAVSTAPVEVSDESPFATLDAVLYRSATPDPDQILVTTTAALPLHGNVDSRSLNFGSEQWLLQTSASEPLNSRLARALPWIILFAGIAGALLVAGMAALLVRRRAYAMAMVEQRTQELRRAMTQLELARAEADDANKAKNRFLSRMSHELRTPLNAVLGFAQLLQRDDRPHDERDAVEHIMKGGQHLLMLINEVLDIARIESGNLAMSTEPVHAEELIGESLDLMRPLAAARSIRLIAPPHGDVANYVFADRQRLKQILLNLLSNAIKYNRHGGSVIVTCEPAGPTRLRINVTDTGHGISPEDVALLFVPFERLGADRTEIEGSGIGLALSRRLAETMGGTLDLTSQPGAGSTFRVELPVVEGAVERFERLTPPTSSWQSSASREQRALVLYIEDNLANVSLLQRVFDDRADIEIMSAMQGRLGVELARQHQPAMILLDLHLPDLQGEEIL